MFPLQPYLDAKFIINNENKMKSTEKEFNMITVTPKGQIQRIILFIYLVSEPIIALNMT